jgi:hypothetical protein
MNGLFCKLVGKEKEFAVDLAFLLLAKVEGLG